MNPFLEKANAPEHYLQSLKDIYPEPYDKNATDPYTKTRIILAAGAEYEANWFSHQNMRKIADLDLRRDISLVRYEEKEQQQKIANLKPVDETVLETTIAYEQLAVDLTAEMAKGEKNFNVKKALDFALLEDFDHLYRYADLLDMDDGIHAERLVGGYTEIMPGRPTLAHHRHPYDNVKKDIVGKENETRTILNTMIITAAEQQTMNYYMNLAAFYKNDRGRKLYEEISLVEEEHVTQYGCLIDTSPDFLECLLWHEYAECYLYWSNFMTETDDRIKKIWEQFLEMEISHLHAARELLRKYEHKDYNEVIRDAEFPEPLSLHENIEYVRKILGETVQFTGDLTDYQSVNSLLPDHRFFAFNGRINAPVKEESGHKVIADYIYERGNDYRYETNAHPVKRMRNRTEDNTSVGVKPEAAGGEGTDGFKPLSAKG
ncbi:MAG: hypothetical protein IJS67_04720 [Clostridia bacterium]|nr:hypothetical protein [Clostridia bacterium]